MAIALFADRTEDPKAFRPAIRQATVVVRLMARLAIRAGGLPAVVGRSLRNKPSFTRRGLWAIADHALVAFVNFLTALLVARASTPADFGTFALAYGAILLAGDVQSALVTQPHNVISHAHRERYSSYTVTTAIGQIALAVLLGGALLLVGLAPTQLGETTRVLFVILAATLFSWLGQEFLRRVLYTEGRFAGAFLNDAFAYIGQLALIAFLNQRDNLSATTALAAIGISSFVAIAVGIAQLRSSFGGRPDWAFLSENWRFGRWLLAGALTSWISIQAYAYLVAGTLGLAAAAVLKAADILLRPLNLGLVLLDSVLLVEFGRDAATSADKLRTIVKASYRWTAGPTLAYCALVSIAADPLMHVLYRGLYDGNDSVVWFLAAFYLLRYAGQIVSIALRARRYSRPMFDGALYAAVFTLTAGWLFVLVGGVPGGAAAMVVSMAITDLVRLRWYGRL